MKKEYIHVRVPKELKKQLEDEAKQKGISLNAYLCIIIDKRKK